MDKYSKENKVLDEDNSYFVMRETLFTEKDLPCLFSYSGYETYKKGMFRERHSFDMVELLFTKRGKGKVFFNSEWHTLEPGMLCLINGFNYHRYETFPDTDWTVHFIQMTGPGVLMYYNVLKKLKYDIIKVADVNKMDYLIDRISLISRKKETVTDFFISATISELMA